MKKMYVFDDQVGSIELLEHMGADTSIVAAARISYAGCQMSSSDTHLLRYLMRMRHTSPFEMCELKFKVVAPIFVARQWMRHRTGSFNEQSARYSELEERFYVPHLEHIQAQSTTNKQGRAVNPVCQAGVVREMMIQTNEDAYRTYKDMLELGVAREVARMVLPVSIYTEFIWKVNLHNLLHFCHLRADPHAQYEIRVYAEAIVYILERVFPATTQAWKDYVRDAVTLSAPALDVIKGDDVERLSKRERTELLDKINNKFF
jgi:thymidylate synthase (FAD)